MASNCGREEMKFLFGLPLVCGYLCLLGAMVREIWWEVGHPTDGPFPGADLALAIAGTLIAVGGVLAVGATAYFCFFLVRTPRNRVRKA